MTDLAEEYGKGLYDLTEEEHVSEDVLDLYKRQHLSMAFSSPFSRGHALTDSSPDTVLPCTLVRCV